MSFVEAAFLPNNWVARGIDQALHNQFSSSALYLGVTVANALFASWLSVMIVAKFFDVAHDRASTGRGEIQLTAAHASGGLAGFVFCYLPLPLRLIAAKDLRTFFRDPLQWSQLVILFGLIVLYLTNMPTLRLRVAASGWLLIIPFLNLCAVSLILATFTCRFVFPLVSLEGQKLWLIGLLPTPRGRILLAKFAFAMTVTVLVAVGAMSLAAVMLELDPAWTAIHLLITVAVCFGLCGFAVGIGARLPMFNQASAARIANGLGGTTNLLASVALVTVVMAGVGAATWRSRDAAGDAILDPTSILICLAVAVFSLAAGAVALLIGARHFQRVEV
jgi:ABC-2 type transport system permease protein